MQNLPDVGYVRTLSPEGVLFAGPGLNLAEERAGPPEAADVLRASSVPFVAVREVYEPTRMIDKVRVVGEALEVPDTADALIAVISVEMKKAMDAVAAQPVQSPRVIFVLSTQGGRIVASGSDTAADAIIQLAGGQNAITGFESYKPMTEEAVAVAQADVVLMMDRRGGHSSTNGELRPCHRRPPQQTTLWCPSTGCSCLALALAHRRPSARCMTR